MGKITTTDPINVDQLRDALDLESNPEMRFVDPPEPGVDLGELLVDNETEVEISVEGVSDAKLEALLKRLTFDPEYGRSGRASTSDPVNIAQVTAAFDGRAVSVHANDITSDEDKVIEVVGMTDAEVEHVLASIEYDAHYGVDPLRVKAAAVASGEATFTQEERDQLEARRILEGGR